MELRSRNKWRECRISWGESAASGKVMLWLRQKLPENKLSWGVKISIQLYFCIFCPSSNRSVSPRIQFPGWTCWRYASTPILQVHRELGLSDRESHFPLRPPPSPLSALETEICVWQTDFLPSDSPQLNMMSLFFADDDPLFGGRRITGYLLPRIS